MTDYPLSTYLAVVGERLAQNDHDGALAAALRGRDAFPEDPRPRCAIARVHMHAERFKGALLPLQQAEALAPRDIETLMLLAECHNRIDDWFESERYYRKVLAIDPYNLPAIVNLEPLIREQRRYGEVRELLGRALVKMPKLADAVATSIGCLDLLHGDLEAGFTGYEGRIEGFHHLRDAYGQAFFPRWDGKADLTGKSVLLRFEQGLGDTIQFVRYAASLKARGACRVDVLCKTVLHRLMRACPAVDDAMAVVDVTDPAQSWDFEVMMMSMPALLGTRTEADIPPAPYLFIADDDLATWAARVSAVSRPGRLKVGFVWSGELKLGQWYTARMNLRRSVPLDLLRPVLDNDCDFFSLQKGIRQLDLREFANPYPIHDLTDACEDFYDTAALIAQLDLVIAVDTSTAHAAGAIGTPVWLLNRYDGCWRWMLDRTDTPWYGNMTIFNQDQFCEWRPTIRRVAASLAAKVEGYVAPGHGPGKTRKS